MSKLFLSPEDERHLQQIGLRIASVNASSTRLECLLEHVGASLDAQVSEPTWYQHSLDDCRAQDSCKSPTIYMVNVMFRGLVKNIGWQGTYDLRVADGVVELGYTRYGFQTLWYTQKLPR